MRIAPDRYRRIVVVAWVALAAIVATGAAVRLTESGLGCEDWPRCSEERFVPEWSFHGWIEFGNRLLSGLVALAVVVAVLSAYRRIPRRPDLVLWAWGLVAGVVAQIVLGGVTVLVDLHPLLVGAHFLLSMVLLWNVAVLWVRASGGPGPAVARPGVTPSLVNHGRLLVAQATVVLVSGTVVTGSGPNSGDSRAERLQFALEDVARIHGVLVWVLLALTVGLVVRLHRAGALHRPLQWLVAAIVVQGGIGYLQYALGVPPLLVELHILGAMAVWCLAVVAHLQLFDRPPESLETVPDRDSDPIGVSDGSDLAKMRS